jgi:NAD(P)-dependent dehydrogenase (short-subunit alcohol dehydrogenase family)
MKVRDVADAALEASVVGSFTRVGSAVRRRLDHWTDIDRADLRGRVIVITGATSGLGRAAAERVARMGAHVVVVARSAERAARTVDELTAVGSGGAEAVIADVSDLDAVTRAAEAILAKRPRVHALVHNAGALDDVRGESRQGIETTVATQVVGPFLLGELLLPALRAARPSRIVWVSSGGMYTEPLAVEQLEMAAESYDGVRAYARAKRAQITLTELLAERHRPDGIVVHAMHPGWADTPGVARSLPVFRRIVGPLLRTPDDGADTLVWLLADDGLPLDTSGLFWLDRRPRSTHRSARTRAAETELERERLWDWVRARSKLAL